MMASPNNKDSQHLMHRIPSGSEGAEIGVWAGSTARQFLNCGISRLELIDPWSVEPYKKSDEYKSYDCLLYTSPSPRDGLLSRMPSSA